MIETIAVASAECGMQELANWFPASRHAELRELLRDLVIGALCVYRDRHEWHVPEPSRN